MPRRAGSLRAPQAQPGRSGKFWETSRASAEARGYGWKWKKLRKEVLDVEPLCRTCRAKGRPVMAKVVDHIMPKARGGSDDLGNLQPLCDGCHAAKTAAESLEARAVGGRGGRE